MELPNFPKIFFIVVGSLVLVNVLLLDLFFVRQRSEMLDSQARVVQLSEDFKTLGTRILSSDLVPTTTVTPSVTTQTPVQQIIESNTCPQSCISLINQTRTTTTTPVSIPTTAPTVSKGEYFVQLGTGSVVPSDGTNSNWKTVDSAQATFDASNYGNIKSATIEVFLHVGASGEVHARLFDTTTPAVFWSSDMSTTSLSSAFVSQPITLSSGTKTYKIQMYTTLSTGYLDQARIHIVTQ